MPLFACVPGLLFCAGVGGWGEWGIRNSQAAQIGVSPVFAIHDLASTDWNIITPRCYPQLLSRSLQL